MPAFHLFLAHTQFFIISLVAFILIANHIQLYSTNALSAGSNKRSLFLLEK